VKKGGSWAKGGVGTPKSHLPPLNVGSNKTNGHYFKTICLSLVISPIVILVLFFVIIYVRK